MHQNATQTARRVSATAARRRLLVSLTSLATVAAVAGSGVSAAGAVTARTATGGTATAGTAPAGNRPSSRHVLLLSVDGLHQSDLVRFVAGHPHSALAGLVRRGTEYTSAQTTFPSDSFPGMVAQLTGATPATSGILYDDTYNHAVLPAGTTHCAGAVVGAEVADTEAADRSQNPIQLDAGQGLHSSALAALPHQSLAATLAAAPALTRAILRMTATPQRLLNPRALAVDPATCTPLFPHDYLRVNTVFDVVRGHRMRTAWSDKHPAYEILSGPSGKGIEDLFTPEINSVADAAGDDWTTDNALTREYDGFKVAAVLNEINGFEHSGQRRVGTPAVFGMNFQSVSTAEKLPVSDGLSGGYLPDGRPGPLLAGALSYVDHEVGLMVRAIRARNLQDSTTIILSAKHGQSPENPKLLRRIDDGAILDGPNAGWASSHPAAKPLVAFAVDDDEMLIWLSDRSPAAESYARAYLFDHSAPANLIGDPKGVTSAVVQHSGLTALFVGAAADRFLGALRGDPRVPDVLGIAQHGVVYTGKTSKIAEHGGDAPADRDVPLIVSGAGAAPGRRVTAAVMTTQIAPTILMLLGLDPRALLGVRRDHTHVLPRP